MILESIRLHPFAGIADKTYSFNKGINVIFGPNEEGKSTVARAIRLALFVETNLTRKRNEDAILEVLPITGGDTIHITLVFTSAGNRFTLEKTWTRTGNGRTQLTSSDGTVMTDPLTVQQILQTLLPANQAVLENILVANQSKLADAINASPEVHSSLSEKLRSAILNGGGISGTHLQEKINGYVGDYFGRWDETANKPEGGPSRESVANRWKSGAGRIVNAWYDWQQALQIEKATEDYETKSNSLQTQQNECNERLNNVNLFLQTHKAAYDGVNRRIAIDADIEKFQKALDGFNTDAQRWPVAMAESSNTKTLFEQVSKELSELDTELEQARQKEAAKSDLEKLLLVNSLQQKVAEAKKAAEAITYVPQADLQTARDFQLVINNIQAKIEGQKLRLHIKAELAAELPISHTGGYSETLTFASGDEAEKEISGGFVVNWQGLQFTVQSANEDIATLEASLLKTQTELQMLLRRYNQETVDGLTTASQTFREAQQQILGAHETLTAALGADTFEELQSRCETATALPGTRDVKILENLVKSKNHVRWGHEQTLKKLGEEIINLESKHESHQNLLKRQVKATIAIEQEEEKLSALPPLPTGFETALDFQDQYSTTFSDKQRLDEMKHGIELAVKDLKEPVQTLAEAKEVTVSAEKHFQRLLEEGNAYCRIQAVLEGILSTADTTAFQPLHTKTESFLQRLSAGRFHSIPFDATQPQKLLGNGIALPVNLLSKGTKDILALALRLAAADVYLNGNRGFVLMDDPLVDMDRTRREASAEVLKQFAQQHQTIIFTCHDIHAGLFNEANIGEAVELN
jgi:exonuclease SbcC